jgi:hypothetical protein
MLFGAKRSVSGSLGSIFFHLLSAGRFLRGPPKQARQVGQHHGLVVKGKRISCPPQYRYRDPARRSGRLKQRDGFEHCFPLIRSLLTSVQRSTSVLFSFVVSFDCGCIIHHPAIKNELRRAISRAKSSQLQPLNRRAFFSENPSKFAVR